MGHDSATIAVFAPDLHVTVTIERARETSDEVHIHPGGQGFWVARMLRHLGERPVLCGPLGGESGQVAKGLFSQWGLDLSLTQIGGESAVIVHDRRDGDRELVAETDSPNLARHEQDDLYGRFLDHALKTGVAVITGLRGELFPVDMYRRLGHDLAESQVRVVTDIHGSVLEAFLEGGATEIVKMSHEDLSEDGVGDVQEDHEWFRVMERFMAAGARNVVVSRQSDPALARFGTTSYRITPPRLEPADHRGAGDSMTAGLATAMRRNSDPVATLRLACAAGAANVTRHGLGSASDDLIPGLAERVEVEVIEKELADG